MNQEQADRIEQKLDRLLNLLGAGGATRLPSELKRLAQQKVLQLEEKRRKKEGHVREIKK
jgi:hypothetical protein